ncbi:recombinase family protein [Planktomarina sp.]|nr:recombinase family protein [Planktomarina sp.]
MKYGYARVSSSGQDLEVQIDALTAAGCETIRQEKVSGTSIQGRDELNTLLEFMRDGDELVITRIDRLARSIRDLQNIVYDLDKKGVTLSATQQPIDTKTSVGKCFLDMLGVFAEFETNLRKERQMEGIAKAKDKGVYKGRKPTIDVQKVKELRDSGLGASKIAKELGIGRASVYRALEV